MSTAKANELSEVLDRVLEWSPRLRIALARRILESLDVTPEARRDAAGPFAS